MPYSFKLSRRIARLRLPAFAALVLALAACDAGSLNPDTSTPADLIDQVPLTDDALADAGSLTSQVTPSLANASYAGGIPFGTFRQPTSQFGPVLSGAMRNIYPQWLNSELAAIKARGGKVILMMAGNEDYYKDGAGHFSFVKWKARVDRFKGTNFTQYINDGTVIGHYLIDEPQDRANWNGVPVPQATLEEMAKYSKSLWPNMVTIARTWPDYLDDWSGSYKYLDAAWAQYVNKRFPNTKSFIDENVSKAQKKGLALIVGLNLIDGSPSKGNMSGTQVKQYGDVLLSSSYPCAFISWQYRDSYMGSRSVRDAMASLAKKAQARPFKTCRGG